MRLRDVGEFGFIERIAPLGNVRSQGVVKGIGDDCAVISLGGPEYLLVTTDLLVERVHFLMDWAPPEIIGAKALAVNLSDIAACGGWPLDAFISLAVPDAIPLEWLERFYGGMRSLGLTYGVNLLGGDTTGSKGDLVINVAVTGRVPCDEVLLRHTACLGDIIVITGPLGESGAGLEMLLHPRDIASEIAEPLKRAHLNPRPHVEEGRILAESRGCSAAIDVSDGLSSDLWHLCNDSGLGAVLYEDRIPVGDALRRAAAIMGRDTLDWILHGGEDYVLLAALKPDAAEAVQERVKEQGRQLFAIGEFVEGRAMELVKNDGKRMAFTCSGWDHFR